MIDRNATTSPAARYWGDPRRKMGVAEPANRRPPLGPGGHRPPLGPFCERATRAPGGWPFSFPHWRRTRSPPEGHGPSSGPSIASARASTPRQWSLAWRATGRQGRLRQACGHAPPQLAGRRDFHPRPVSVPSSLMNWARWCWVHARRGRSGDCAPHAPDECGAAGSVVAWAVSASAFCRSGSFPSTAAVWQPSCGRILTAPIHSSALSARPPPSGRAPLYRVTNARRVLFAVPT